MSIGGDHQPAWLTSYGRVMRPAEIAKAAGRPALAVFLLTRFDHASLFGGVGGVGLERHPVRQLGLIGVADPWNGFLVLLGYVGL
jgi:hypothetical protein